MMTCFNTARYEQASAIRFTTRVGMAGTVYNIATLTFAQTLRQTAKGP